MDPDPKHFILSCVKVKNVYEKNFNYIYRSPFVIAVLLSSAVSASPYSANSEPASARVLTEDLSVSVPEPTSAVYFGPPRRAGILNGLYAILNGLYAILNGLYAKFQFILLAKNGVPFKPLTDYQRQRTPYV